MDRGREWRSVSRRKFLRTAGASGIALTLTRLAIAEEPGFLARETLPGRKQWNPAATGAGRIDGVAKVTGAKLYVSDFRAADMPGWPSRTSHALLLRAADATHVYAGLNLSPLSGGLKPAAIVTADDLVRMGTRVPAFYAGDLLCPVGKTPLYLGQPIALLVFEDFDTFDQARLALRDVAFAKFGQETGPVEMPNYGAFRFTRLAGPTPEAADIYSPVKNGWAKSRQVPESSVHRGSHLASAANPRRAGLCRSGRLRREDTGGAGVGQSGAPGAGAAIRHPVGRSNVSRAGMRTCVVRLER